MPKKDKVKTVAFNLRVSPEFKRIVGRLADQDCRSQAAVVEYAVLRYAESVGIPREDRLTRS